MLNIYAQAMLNATRLNRPMASGDGPDKASVASDQKASRKRAWLPEGHWWVKREIDPNQHRF